MKVLSLCAALALLLMAAPAHAQARLDANEIATSLAGVGQAGLDAAAMRQAALDNIRNNPGENAVGRAQLFPDLEKLAQFTIEINFNFNSDVIRPESYHAIGLMADALHNPVLLGYKFLVIGHTDAVGKREYNLKLSQRRAEAIRIALIKPFGVDPARLEAVGLGEEQLRDPAKPDAAVNRRVQLINVGQ